MADELIWAILGPTNTLRFLYVVYTMRGEEITRPVTAFEADRRSRDKYLKSKGAN